MIIGNPIQLAAISNYKLAQLTFAPPDVDSLRKTALIKNVQEKVYQNTPEEWLKPMTRWTFFTPESLDEMTQDTLEDIFQKYVRMIEQFHPYGPHDDADDDADDDDEGNRRHYNPSIISEASSIFSQPNLTLSNEAMGRYPDDKPLPKSPISEEMRRRSIRARMSWTCDTGLTSNALSQSLANEITNLFDMEFTVDIKVSTAPRLPELPFGKNRQSQYRASVDSLMNLIPTFETFQLPDTYTPRLTPPPARSSSLRHRQMAPSPSPVPITPTARTQPISASTPPKRIGGVDLLSDLSRKTSALTKKKSIRKLAALVSHKRKSPPLKTKAAAMSAPTLTLATTSAADDFFSGSTITINSTTSSLSSSSASDLTPTYASSVGNMYSQKPLPETPLYDLSRSPSLSHSHSHTARSSSAFEHPSSLASSATMSLDTSKTASITCTSDSDLSSHTSSIFSRMTQWQTEATNENDDGLDERRQRKRSDFDLPPNRGPSPSLSLSPSPSTSLSPLPSLREDPIPIASTSFTRKMASFGRRIASPILQHTSRVDC